MSPSPHRLVIIAILVIGYVLGLFVLQYGVDYDSVSNNNAANIEGSCMPVAVSRQVTTQICPTRRYVLACYSFNWSGYILSNGIGVLVNVSDSSSKLLTAISTIRSLENALTKNASIQCYHDRNMTTATVYRPYISGYDTIFGLYLIIGLPIVFLVSLFLIRGFFHTHRNEYADY